MSISHHYATVIAGQHGPDLFGRFDVVVHEGVVRPAVETVPGTMTVLLEPALMVVDKCSGEKLPVWDSASGGLVMVHRPGPNWWLANDSADEPAPPQPIGTVACPPSP